VEACALPTTEQPLRLAEFDNLFAEHLRTAQVAEGPTPITALLVLDGPPDLGERVQRLADAETQCCSFFTFTVRVDHEDRAAVTGWPRVTLEVRVPQQYAPVLGALVARAQAMAVRRS
jgi:hypothetical protein